MSELKLNRRAFLKALAAGGVTATMMPALANAAPQAAPEGDKDTKAVYIYTKGPGFDFNWQNGDTLKWLPPEEIPDGKASDALAALSKDKLKDIYRKMFTNYRWETKIKDLNVEGKEALGSGHMYIGEEAIATGVMAALNPDDMIASTHRGHGHLIAKGGDINRMMAEFFAKETGVNGGFGGSMHLTEMKKGILGMNGIVGAGWMIAAGAALASQVKGDKLVSVAFAGDGAANNAYFLDAVRNATLYSLPVVFVVENNFYNIGVPMAVVCPRPRISDYAAGFDIPTVSVDGNDVAAVYYAAKAAVDRARAGKGPSVIEATTFRWYDHSGFAGAKLNVDGAFGLPYRSDEEVKTWMTRAPWIRFGKWLVKKKLATQEELTAIEKEVQAAVDKSVEFAKAGKYPAPDKGLQFVFAEGKVAPKQFIDGVVPKEFTVKATEHDEFKRVVALFEQTGGYLS
jgi:pyruvate dehydrogenase E1 component alpha subunit